MDRSARMDRGDILQDPEIGFFQRNDHATIQIMAKAATIVPKACDILGISLSDSESEAEEENDDTAAARGERSPTQSHHHDQEDEPDTDESSLAQSEGEGAGGDDSNSTTTVDNHQVQEARPTPKFRARLLTPTRVSGLEAVLGSHVRKSRKRCASTPSTLSFGPTSSNLEGLRGLNPPTNKKRRFPSISISGPGSETNINANGSGGSGDFSGLGVCDNPAWGNLSTEEYAIRMKMMQDMETLQEQLSRLAELEKQQYALMQMYFQVKQKQQHDDTLQPNDSTTNRDGTNVSTTATTITTTEEIGIDEASNENSAGEGDVEETIQNEQDMMDIDEEVNILNDAEIFTDADLNIGAEEIVVDAEIAEQEIDQEIGSLM